MAAGARLWCRSGATRSFVESTVQAGDRLGLAPDRGALTARGYPIQDQAAGVGLDGRRVCFVKEVSWSSTTARRRPPSWRGGRGANGCARIGRTCAASTTFALAGEQDITAQVCIDQLPAPSRIESQTSFLQPIRHRRTRRRGPSSLGGRGRTARRRGTVDAQPGARSRGAAGATRAGGVSCGYLDRGRPEQDQSHRCARWVSHGFANVPSGVTT